MAWFAALFENFTLLAVLGGFIEIFTLKIKLIYYSLKIRGSQEEDRLKNLAAFFIPDFPVHDEIHR